MTGTLPRRLVIVLVLLLLAWGLFVAWLVWRVTIEREHETLQRLSHGLARHIVERWPELGGGGQDDPRARQELLRMLMTVNPGIQAYLLDATGRVDAYIGEPGMVRMPQVDVESIQAFLGGAALPLYGSDPMGSGVPRLFTAAMFPPRIGEAQSGGYLYIVLDSPARGAVANQLSPTRIWGGVVWAAATGLLVVLLVGALAVRLLTRPLGRLAADMALFDLNRPEERSAEEANLRRDDEVAMLRASFDAMARRLGEQHESQQRQSTAHREVIANVAHDLRTPLTALHGHLEALRAKSAHAGVAAQHLDIALSQSDKLRHLTQQLFELATLQSMDQPVHSERFRLDEVVADAVQKFEVLAAPRHVALAGTPPGAVELDGDLHLIERALTNLIDNAVRHTPTEDPVQVSVRCDEHEVSVMVEDKGPGLPIELVRRLESGASVRDPAVRRHAGGGMGGLGLAIAQRIAILHGGRLQATTSAGGGTQMCLALPRSAENRYGATAASLRR
jgi:signal transduction histidine kinase